jgi:hypothetical protein
MSIEQLSTKNVLLDWMTTINSIIVENEIRDAEDETRDEAIGLLEEKISTLNEHPFTVDENGQLCIVISE